MILFDFGKISHFEKLEFPAFFILIHIIHSMDELYSKN